MVSRSPLGRRPSLRVALAALASAASVAGPAASQAPGRAWTIADSLEIRRFADQNNHGWDTSGARTVTFSPSGSRFFVMTDQGRLACDCNVSRLIVFDAAAVRASLEQGRPAPPPVATLGFRTRSHFFLAAQQARWIDDDNLMFLAAQPESEPEAAPQGPSQLYRYSLPTGTMTRLSDVQAPDWPGNEFSVWITRYVASLRGQLFVTSAERSRPPPPYPLRLVESVDTRQLGIGRDLDNVETLHIVAGGARRSIAASGVRAADSSPVILPASLAADAGEAIVAFGEAERAPARWDGYDAIGRYRSDASFRRVTLATGEVAPLLDAPLGTATRMGAEAAARYPFGLRPAILPAGARHAVLVNAALPLAAGDTAAGTAYILSYSIESGRAALILPLDGPLGAVRSARMDGHCLVLSIERGSQERSHHFIRAGDDWRARPSCGPMARPSRLDVAVQQDANLPPRLVATRGGARHVLIGPDPRLENVRYAPSRPFSWTEPDGRRVTGGLRLPLDRPARGLPLVIINYYYRPHAFSPDGVFPSFSAQSLLAAGMAVLETDTVNADRPDVSNTPREGPAMVARVDAAVAALAAQGIVDPARVGMIGFSRGGYMTRYVAFFPQAVRLAAAIADDGHDAGYFSYLFSLHQPEAVARYDLGPHGESHFWEDKAAWLSDTMSLNYERLRTPLLASTHNGGQGPARFAAVNLEASGATRAIGAPVQLVHYPYTSHQPHRPREREAMFALHLAWMRFWLQGVEDRDAVSDRDLARWREMRRRLDSRRTDRR